MAGVRIALDCYHELYVLIFIQMYLGIFNFFPNLFIGRIGKVHGKPI